MPLYSFENTETGEEVDIMVSLADYDDFMANNPHLIRTYTKMSLASGVGGIKTDDLFQDEVLGRIGEHHKGTAMGDRYGSKSIKDVKTKQVVEKWKKKRSADPNK